MPWADAGLAKGNDGDGDERAAERDDGREKIKRTIDSRGNQIFFEERLGAVDERLQKAEGANAAGSPAILDAADKLALEKHGVGDAHEHHHRDHGDFGKAPEKECENRHVRLAFFEERVSELASQRVSNVVGILVSGGRDQSPLPDVVQVAGALGCNGPACLR